MRLTTRRTILTLAILTGLSTGTASAQVFGTFSWQMQPYCNVVTLTITQFPGGYTVDGNDNQCGSGTLAAASGQVHINPNGTVGVNFAIITTPTGKAVHVAALLSPTNGSGTWTDSVGNSGTFALGANTPALPVRPFPASGLGASIITTTEIAAGAVGGSDINTAEVQARVTGTCPVGQAVTGVDSNGTVACAPALDAEVNFRVAAHAATAVLTGNQAVLWSSVVDNVGGGTYSAGTGAYTVPAGGLYLVTYSVLWQGQVSTVGRRCTFILLGSAATGGAACGQPTGTNVAMGGSAVFRLAAGTTISVIANQTSGVADSLGTSSTTGLTVTRLR